MLNQDEQEKEAPEQSPAEELQQRETVNEIARKNQDVESICEERQVHQEPLWNWDDRPDQ